MFNAVSKAAMETARLTGLFDANLALVQQAQQAMAEIDLARHVADHATHLDLRNGVKYATETSIAMKVTPPLPKSDTAQLSVYTYVYTVGLLGLLIGYLGWHKGGAEIRSML